MPYHSWQFTHAITRRPPATICDGLRAVDQGNPDFDLINAHHRDYVAALKNAGLTVFELAPLEQFPDCCFVEDTALCLPQGAIVLRPGAVTRLGEASAMAPHLAGFFNQVEVISGPGFVEGGDILVTGREILVGRSARTDAAGIAELAQIVGAWGHRVREVITPPGVLHFKTDCSLLDHQTILATPRLKASGCFADYTVIETAEGEEACANAIRVNATVIMPAGFPKTAEILTARGYDVVSVNNTECAKIDGGMSCLSLRFTPTK
jgi:dimethylargininase